jgi:hypothetical protein
MAGRPSSILMGGRSNCGSAPSGIVLANILDSLVRTKNTRPFEVSHQFALDDVNVAFQ